MPQDVSIKSSEKPLQDTVLCCTSIPPEVRTRLTEYAEQMGAEHRLDLTSDVTHLLVGETDTPKYQYVAREREDVKVLQPEWVEAVRQRWMADQPLDMQALDAEYKVPTLAGLKICITGFDDLTFRAQLQDNIKKNGGLYTGDLTKDVTHLIAMAPEGKKYEYASLWQKKIVSLKWYKDTLARGMQLDESLYHPSKPVDEQGVGAWNRKQDKTSNLGKRQRTDNPAQEPSRKLRRTASARFSSQSDNLWTDIVGGSNSQNRDEDRGTLRPAKSMPAIKLDSFTKENTDATIEAKPAPAHAVPTKGVFQDTHFALHGFDTKRRGLLRDALLGLGATIYDSIPDLLDLDGVLSTQRFLLVPHQTKRQKLQILKEIEGDITIVNELWIEWCMTIKRLALIAEYPLGGVTDTGRNPNISKLLINASGFPSVQTMHISKVVVSMGARYGEVFTPEHSVLVCHSSNTNPQKAIHALQWKIPIVSEKWLWQLIASGDIPSFGPFLLRSRPKSEDDFRQRGQSESKLMRQKKKSPTPDPSFHTQDTLPVTSKTERDLSPGSPSQKPSQNMEPADDVKPCIMPLKEVSPNLSPKKQSPAPAGGKKKLFRTFDGSSSIDDSGTAVPMEVTRNNNEENPRRPFPQQQEQDPIADFLAIKAQAAARAAEHNKPSSKQGGQKKLLGRALSNLSNASRVSQSARHSRASSIDSINTDGLGTELSNSALPAWSNLAKEESTAKTSFGLTGRAKLRTAVEDSFAPLNPPLIPAIDLNDPNLLRDEYADEDLAPQRTQLGYEESEEAIAMREKLAERRRARGRLAQEEDDGEVAVSKKEREQMKEKRVIRDDETLLGRGRRTRQKGKSIDALTNVADEFAL